jgi:predicted nuclease of restriction endonuclease-like (RecB) superfamily
MDNSLELVAEQWSNNEAPSFDELTTTIIQTHNLTQTNAVKAINQMMTLRNWLIGFFIVEYEQSGSDRAKYGDRLLKRLEERVKTRGLNLTLFKHSRRFYLLYPQIGELLGKSPTVSNFLVDENICQEKSPTLSDFSETPLVSSTVPTEFKTSSKLILEKLSFSHIVEIMTQDDPLARFFYETECIKGTWSVRELRRQISTNLYYRSGVSKNPQKLLQSIKAETSTVALAIRQPFTFEFLGLDAKEVVDETDLEKALVTHLQDFLLELGRGFCFEARQKRIIIDDEYFFVDLVFYNRILHCNVIIELKNDEFHHADLSQLNAYVSYFRDKEMQPGDNPPVGILLCTRKGEKMVEYALAGMDNHLFVSTYMLTLPNTKLLEEFLLNETKDLN